MESGELTLDESIAAYRRGAELARYCQARLAQAEQDIKQLEGDLLKPLDPADLKGGRHMTGDSGGRSRQCRSPEAFAQWMHDASERFEAAAADLLPTRRKRAAATACRRCATPCSAVASMCGRCSSMRPAK